MVLYKSRLQLYEQYLNKLPLNTLDNLVKVIERDLKPLKYAIIVNYNKENPTEDYVSLVLKFQKPHTLNSVARILNDDCYNMTLCDSLDHIIPYLILATDSKYSSYEVIANFDYVDEIAKSNTKNKRNRTNLRNR